MVHNKTSVLPTISIMINVLITLLTRLLVVWNVYFNFTPTENILSFVSVSFAIPFTIPSSNTPIKKCIHDYQPIEERSLDVLDLEADTCTYSFIYLYEFKLNKP
ncbi:hypothetical protein J3Q64DRAFT_1700730 [Phycomyces blakesleeanus]|uniref:Uncharacterized protein n=1 Tax=Phycomyces blakesleeanus TaxID=4837 RepID=A0ABR3AT23_PHYBL